MTPNDASRQFLRAFCAGDVERLEPLLAEDLRFRGPFLAADSRAAYLESLRGNLEPAGFEVLKIFEDGEDVCLIYDYKKTDSSVRIAQWNRFRGDEIAEILLIFDGR